MLFIGAPGLPELALIFFFLLPLVIVFVLVWNAVIKGKRRNSYTWHLLGHGQLTSLSLSFRR